MGIKSKLYLGASVLIILALVVVLAQWAGTKQINTTLERGRVADLIVRGIFGLNVYMDDYLLNPTDETSRQWKIKYNSIAEIINSKIFNDPIDQLLINTIRQDYQSMENLFRELNTLSEKKMKATPGSEERLVSQLLVKSRAIVFNSEKLSERNFQERTELRARIATITLSFLILLVGFIISSVILFYHAIFKPIVQLHKGTQVIAGGNLDYRVEVKSRDEIGQLARSFNEMAIRLKESYAGLEEKVRERTKALVDKNVLLEESQEALQKERDRAKAIVSSMGDGLLVLDKDFKITIINPVAEKLLGVSPSEALGKNWYDYVKVFKGDKEISREGRSPLRSLETGKPIITTIDDNHYYLTPSGREFPVASVTSPLTDEKGQITGVIKVFRDITHDKEEKQIIEKKVEERTRELSEEKARLVGSIEAIVRAYAMLDTRGSVILTNHKLAIFLGDPGGAWTLEKIQTKLGDAFDIVSAYKRAVVERKNAEVKEIALGSKYFDLHVAPVFLQNKELIGVLFLLGDITEQKILERSKDEFFSIASHELRTPLTAIRGNTSLILDYYKDKLTDKTLKEMVDDIHDSSIRLIQIVNDFLNVSRLEQGKIQFIPEEFDFVQLVQAVFKELEINAEEKKLFLKLDVHEELPKIFADKNKTKEVLINLIGNSIKYTDQGGVTVSIAKKDSSLKVSIIDTGHGIPLKNQALLFHKFQQAQEQILTRDFTRGTGLGLYIAKLLLEGMGGRIWLENTEEGRGSIFSFTIPVMTRVAATVQHTPEVGKQEKPVANTATGVL